MESNGTKASHSNPRRLLPGKLSGVFDVRRQYDLVAELPAGTQANFGRQFGLGVPLAEPRPTQSSCTIVATHGIVWPGATDDRAKHVG